MGLNLPWSEEQIDALRPFRMADGRVFKLQDLLIDAVIDGNPEVPINYSVTVRSSDRSYRARNIDSMLSLNGMMFRLNRDQTKLSVDTKGTMAYYTDSARFKYRSMADQSVYRNEATRRVIGNVANSVLMAADGLRREGLIDEAKRVARINLEIVPGSSRAINALASLYAQAGELDSLNAMTAMFPQADQNQIRLAVAQGYRRQEKSDEARLILDSLLTEQPTWRPALDEMMRLLVRENDVGTMVTVLQRWVRHNPDDAELRQALQELMAEMERMQSPTRDSS
jgi:Flp pilus assembly protein TadD